MTIGDCIPVDSRIKVSNGRAVFRLANETLLRAAGETQLRFSAPTEKRWIHLIDGLLHLITRTPRDLEVESEFVNAGVKGTEFIVVSDRATESGEVIVLEGEVVASNSRGEKAVTGGSSVIVRGDQPPRYTTLPALRHAVQWTLHYPPLPLPSQPRFAVVNNAMKASDLPAALRALEAMPDSERDTDYLTMHAAIDLQRGEVAAARTQLQRALSLDDNASTALALQAATEIATGNNDRADELLSRSRDDDTIALITRSYLQQARFDLSAALATAEQAAELDPNNAWIQARIAELALINDDTPRADAAIQRALTLRPNLGRAHALNGFLQLQRLDLDAAEHAFQQAARLDSTDPLPRLGLGLIEIRHDNLKAGREQLELAVALDPGQSLLRSYLGKAYQLEQRDKLAGDQYELAKQFDNADPTPWLYSALLAQSQNRPFEALQLIEESIERNDNRAVYRSRLGLDRDEATRTASQAGIYRDLGFKQLAQRSASRAVSTAPGDYGGHRQLAESYADDPQYDAARASEVLQAQLLQPLSATPISPLLAETNLLVTEGSGPGALGYRNYDALFVRERPNVQVAGLGGSNNTGAGQVSVSGIESRLAYAVDYYHYETQGYRENNDARYDIGAAYAGLQASESLHLTLSASTREEDRGDITEQLFDETRPYIELESRTDSVMLGGRYSASPLLDLVGAITHREKTLFDLLRQPTLFGDLFNNVDLSDNNDQMQMQAIISGLAGRLVTGIEWSETNRQTSTSLTTTDPILVDVLPSDPLAFDGINRYRDGYAYWSSDSISKLQLTLGINFSELDSDEFSQPIDGWYPKFAVQYRVHPRLSFRASYFESLKRPTASEQTLEPTQVGTFNQMFDDREGTETTQYGLGFDIDLDWGHRIGAEWLERQSDIPLIINSNTDFVETEQSQAQFYWSWTGTNWAINLSYGYDRNENSANFVSHSGFLLANIPSLLSTQRAPLELRWFPINGVTLTTTITHFDQRAERPVIQLGFDENGIPSPIMSVEKGSDSFMLVDLAAAYRFWHQHAELSLRCLNVTNEDFRYQNTNLYDTTPQLPPYHPERTLFAGFKLLF